MPEFELDAEHLLRVLLSHEVKFVMIGGMAGAVHGSPFPTEDLDITPERSAENLGRLSNALDALDARIRTEGVEGGLPFGHDADSLASVSVWNLVTPYGDLDISFVPNGTSVTATCRTMPLTSKSSGWSCPSRHWPTSSAANRPQTGRRISGCSQLSASSWRRGSKNGPE